MPCPNQGLPPNLVSYHLIWQEELKLQNNVVSNPKFINSNQ